jgi:hypothetical protein
MIFVTYILECWLNRYLTQLCWHVHSSLTTIHISMYIYICLYHIITCMMYIYIFKKTVNKCVNKYIYIHIYKYALFHVYYCHLFWSVYLSPCWDAATGQGFLQQHLVVCWSCGEKVVVWYTLLTHLLPKRQTIATNPLEIWADVATIHPGRVYTLHIHLAFAITHPI